jgi:hypothetical protein
MFEPNSEFNFNLEIDFEKIVSSTAELQESRQSLIDDMETASKIIQQLKTNSTLNYVEREEYIEKFEHSIEINKFLIDKLSQVISIREILGE